MTSVIWKFPLHHNGSAGVSELPRFADILKVAKIESETWIWARFNAKHSGELMPMKFRIFATGQHFETTGLKFIDTIFEGPFVWHIFKEMA